MTTRVYVSLLVFLMMYMNPLPGYASWSLTRIVPSLVYTLDTDGDHLAYTQFRSLIGFNADVYLYTPGNGGTVKVNETLGTDQNWGIEIQGGKVWFMGSNDYYMTATFYTYDIQSGQLAEVNTINGEDIWPVGVRGNELIITMENDFWLCGQGTLTRLTNSSSLNKEEALVAGNVLVWIGYEDFYGPYEVYRTNTSLSYPNQSQVTNRGNGFHRHMFADGNDVVWEWHDDQYFDATREFYHYNVSTGGVELIESSDARAVPYQNPQCDIEYPKVVYVKQTDSQSQLKMYDINSRTHTTMYTTDIRISVPVIQGTRTLYFSDGCTGNHCEELNVITQLGQSSFQSERITTFGEDSYIAFPMFLENGNVSFLRYLYSIPTGGQLYLAREGNPSTWTSAASILDVQTEKKTKRTDTLLNTIVSLFVPIGVLLAWRRFSHRNE